MVDRIQERGSSIGRFGGGRNSLCLGSRERLNTDGLGRGKKERRKEIRLGHLEGLCVLNLGSGDFKEGF